MLCFWRLAQSSVFSGGLVWNMWGWDTAGKLFTIALHTSIDTAGVPNWVLSFWQVSWRLQVGIWQERRKQQGKKTHSCPEPPGITSSHDRLGDYKEHCIDWDKQYPVWLIPGHFPRAKYYRQKWGSSKPVLSLTESFDFCVQVIQASVLWGFHRGTLILLSFPVFDFYTSFFFQKVHKGFSLSTLETSGKCVKKILLFFFSMELYCSNYQTALTGKRVSVLPAEMFEGLPKKVPQLLAVGLSFLTTMSMGNSTVQGWEW